ncbi:MAG TPA: CHAP domain-containing protein, partial [Candidatus Saccharimonadales bacterium]|nr:CHAP domain-containing protein [Candidatus Saccharimonadales bacterium]
MGPLRERFWVKAIAVSVVATILSVSTGHAANAGQTYPYATKPCIWQPYAVTGTTTNWCADYDFGDAPDDNTAGNVISPLGYYYRNCTDYIAWRLSAAGVPTAQYTNLGNAKDWPAAATLKGLVVDETPTASAVAVRTAGPYGHAAFVEAVNADGTITVSQYNYAGQGEYSLQTGLPGSFGFTVYIHFQMQPPAMVVAPPVISAAAPESTSGIPAVDS